MEAKTYQNRTNLEENRFDVLVHWQIILLSTKAPPLPQNHPLSSVFCFVLYYSTCLLSSFRNQDNVHFFVCLFKTVRSVAELHAVHFFNYYILLQEMTYKWKRKSILSALTVHQKYINCASGWRARVAYLSWGSHFWGLPTNNWFHHFYLTVLQKEMETLLSDLLGRHQMENSNWRNEAAQLTSHKLFFFSLP